MGGFYITAGPLHKVLISEDGDDDDDDDDAGVFVAFFADTVFFHLPPLSEDMKCVYGVSCYRQIEAKVRYEALCS